MIRYEEKNRDGERFLVVTKASPAVRDLVIPQEEGGLAVREIGPHAFAASSSLKSVRLPACLHTIGSFAFHNCAALSLLSLHDGVSEYGDGAIRQCTSLSVIRIRMQNENYALVARLLSDCDNTLTLFLLYDDGEEIRLTFPGFRYDFTENTMARTIQFNIEGSGMAFRDCVRRSGIDYAAYDRTFNRAKLDDIATSTALVLNRLRFPHALGAQAREAYETHVRTHAAQILKTLVAQQDLENLRYMGTVLLAHAASPSARLVAPADIDAALAFCAAREEDGNDARAGSCGPARDLTQVKAILLEAKAALAAGEARRKMEL